MSTWEQVPATVDVVHVLGDSFELMITESTPTYLVTGATIAAAVFSRADEVRSSPLLELTGAVSPSGTLTLSATAAAIVAALAAGSYVWRVRSTNGSTVRTVVTGEWTERMAGYG